MTTLEEIKTRAEAATEGPWKALGTGVAGGDHWYVCDDGQSIASIASNDGENEDQRQPDAEFIAAARTDVPKLLEVIAALDKMAGVWLAGHQHDQHYGRMIRHMIAETLDDDGGEV